MSEWEPDGCESSLTQPILSTMNMNLSLRTQSPSCVSCLCVVFLKWLCIVRWLLQQCLCSGAASLGGRALPGPRRRLLLWISSSRSFSTRKCLCKPLRLSSGFQGCFSVVSLCGAMCCGGRVCARGSHCVCRCARSTNGSRLLNVCVMYICRVVMAAAAADVKCRKAH